MIQKYSYTNAGILTRVVHFLIQSSDNELSRTEVIKALRRRDVKVNGKRVSEDIELCGNEVVEAFIPVNNTIQEEKEKRYEVVFSDDNIIVVNKLQGISVHSGADDDDNLIDEIRTAFPGEFEPALCHRIDRNTGGLVLIARNKKSLDVLVHAIQNGEVIKTYKAIVSGYPPEKSGTLLDYLSKNERLSKVFIHKTKEQNDLTAVTHYKVIRTSRDLTLMSYTIETGRMHQIRAQSAHHGFPVLGDGKYGVTKINREYKIKKQLLFAVQLDFRFKSRNILDYLNNQSFTIDPGIESLFETLSRKR